MRAEVRLLSRPRISGATATEDGNGDRAHTACAEHWRRPGSLRPPPPEKHSTFPIRFLVPSCPPNCLAFSEAPSSTCSGSFPEFNPKFNHLVMTKLSAHSLVPCSSNTACFELGPDVCAVLH